MNQNELAHQITDLVEGRIDAVINWRDTHLETPEELCTCHIALS